MARPPFPDSLPAFIRQFPNEDAAISWIFAARWPDGWKCPKCDAAAFYARKDRRLMECAACGEVTSVTAGTVMHKTRTPLVTWLLTAWLMVTDKRGISSCHLERQLGLRHETAFQMLHKLRAGMVAPDREMLRGTVEVDESYFGAAKEIAQKTLVAGAVEVRKGTNKKGEAITFPGRIRLQHVPSRQAEDLLRFAIENIEEGSVVVTDGLSSYADVPLAGFKRKIERPIGGRSKDDVLKHYHLMISNLKTWLQGTHHGRVEPKHLQAYLNEYAFRYNRRGNLYAAFARLLGIGTQVRALEYDELYGSDDAGSKPRRRKAAARP